ncbi:sensor histidine kinase [Agromyces sp. NPDC058110]|uniref:sensor histidine kinase n=1 Tax=Agromyces sp. NPDC058110 TaxID=3346345 RepID=UPI0036DE2083
MSQPATGFPRRRRMPDRAWDAIVVVWCLLVAFAPTGKPRGLMEPSLVLSQPWALLIVAAEVVALLFRRRRPIGAFAATVVLFGLGQIAFGNGAPFVMPMIIAAYGVGRRATRRTGGFAIIAAIVVVVGLELIRAGFVGFDGSVIAGPAVMAAAAALGDATKSRHAYILELADRAERAEATRDSEARRRVAEERLRIARDLHDAVAHRIAVVNLQSGVAQRALAEGREPDLATARESIAVVRRAAGDVLGEIGDLLSALRAEDEGVQEPELVPQAGLAQLDALVEEFAASGLAVTVRREGSAELLPDAVDRTAYQVLREAFTNAHKHGSGGHAHVLVEQDAARLAITVTNPVDTDETRTPAPTTGHGLGGHGLVGLRERVLAVRGTVEAGTAGGVFRVRAELPLGRDGTRNAGGGV